MVDRVLPLDLIALLVLVADPSEGPLGSDGRRATRVDEAVARPTARVAAHENRF
jgi:hypothetical protein